MPTQPEIPFPFELNKTTFASEILKSVRLNHSHQLLELIEQQRASTLRTLNVTSISKQKIPFDVLHLYALALALRSNLFDDRKLNQLATLDYPDYIENVRCWYADTIRLVTALTQLHKVDLGVLKQFLNEL